VKYQALQKRKDKKLTFSWRINSKFHFLGYLTNLFPFLSVEVDRFLKNF